MPPQTPPCKATRGSSTRQENLTLPCWENFSDNLGGARSEQLSKVPGKREDTLVFISAYLWIIFWTGIRESRCVPGLGWRVVFSARNGKIQMLSLETASFAHHGVLSWDERLSLG